MKKNVAAVRLVDRDEATETVELPGKLRLSPGAIAGVAREGLLAMYTAVGLAVIGEMMTTEVPSRGQANLPTRAQTPWPLASGSRRSRSLCRLRDDR